MSILSNKPDKSKPPFYYYAGKGWEIDTKVKIGGTFKKLHRKWFATLNEAKEAYPNIILELKEKLDKKAAYEERKKIIYYEDFEDEFIEYRKTQVKGASIRVDRQRLKTYIQPFAKGKPISECFKAETARRVQLKVASAQLTRKTKNKIISLYLWMLEYAFQHEYLEEDADYRKCKAEMHYIRATEENGMEERQEKVVLTESQCNALLEAIYDPADKLLTTIMLETGVRIGEALPLRPMDFNFQDGLLNISRTVSSDEWGNRRIFNRTKTKLGLRSIPVKKSLLYIVQAYAEKLGIAHDGLLFPSTEKNSPCMDGSAYRLRLKRYCIASKLPLISPHCLRHTFATRLSLNCHSDAERQARAYIMGHSVVVDEEVYTAHNRLETAKTLIS